MFCVVLCMCVFAFVLFCFSDSIMLLMWPEAWGVWGAAADLLLMCFMGRQSSPEMHRELSYGSACAFAASGLH